MIEGAKEGASVRELCIKADQRIEEETGKAFKKDKKLQKGNLFCLCETLFLSGGLFYVPRFSGIAFPCCLSVNNCICHFSPLLSDQDVVLKDGDMVKVRESSFIPSQSVDRENDPK